jgi:hypothetical protein
MQSRRFFNKLPLVAACAGLALGISSCSSSPSSGGSGGGAGTTIDLVAYSTPASAYAKLIAAFEKTTAGKGITVSTSFGASGTEANDVVDGQPADLVNFSLEPDMAKVVKAGLVSSSWDKGPTKGMVTDSIVSFVVRPGNPKHITDLGRPGEAGRAGHHAQRVQLGQREVEHHGRLRCPDQSRASHPAQAQAVPVGSLLHNAVAQPSSASAALQTFLSGRATCCSTTRTTPSTPRARLSRSTSSRRPRRS